MIAFTRDLQIAGLFFILRLDSIGLFHLADSYHIEFPPFELKLSDYQTFETTSF